MGRGVSATSSPGSVEISRIGNQGASRQTIEVGIRTVAVVRVEVGMVDEAEVMVEEGIAEVAAEVAGGVGEAGPRSTRAWTMWQKRVTGIRAMMIARTTVIEQKGSSALGRHSEIGRAVFEVFLLFLVGLPGLFRCYVS